MNVFHLEVTVDEKKSVQDLSLSELKDYIGRNVWLADPTLFQRKDNTITLVLEWTTNPSEPNDVKPRVADITFDFSDELLKDICDFLTGGGFLVTPIAIPYYWIENFTLDHVH
jgi:hypothetical protein